MMRVLITCWPFTGHVLPQLALASALRDRGHQVSFYTGRAAAGVLTGAGFPVHPLEAVDEEAVHRAVRLLEIGSDGGRIKAGLTRRVFREWLVDTIPGQLADLDQILARDAPDVVVTDLSMWAPIVVLADSAAVPVVLASTFLGPVVPGPDAPPAGFGLRPPLSRTERGVARLLQAVVDRAGAPLRSEVDQIRRGRGLPPLGMTVNARTAQLPLYLVPSLPSLDWNRDDLPPTVRYVGPMLWYPPTGAAERDWLSAVPRDRPWVHLTESTLSYGDPFLLRAAAQGLPAAGVRVVATTGRQRDAAALGLGDPSPEVHLTPWIGHDVLLPHCDAVVSNGGTATVMSALVHGLPMVIVPTTWDKPDNARRVAEAGAGIVVSRRNCTPERLRDAVQLLLQNPAYRRNAQALAGQLAAAPGPAGAARLVEQLPVRDVVR